MFNQSHSYSRKWRGHKVLYIYCSDKNDFVKGVKKQVHIDKNKFYIFRLFFVCFSPRSSKTTKMISINYLFLKNIWLDVHVTWVAPRLCEKFDAFQPLHKIGYRHNELQLSQNIVFDRASLKFTQSIPVSVCFSNIVFCQGYRNSSSCYLSICYFTYM